MKRNEAIPGLNSKYGKLERNSILKRYSISALPTLGGYVLVVVLLPCWPQDLTGVWEK
ncbi:hypothetical protein BDV29DRAFT_167204 [Aspergillus leporis]|uniref:Uncharacterized protein n=1 Tax=Aspergillus leporis TaxID=41062 RepID=A0A5N5XBI2_9EURO|nr:hypothetical protein BDV29DRAFT_167204 [Aspergillus leporis]